MPRIPLNVRIGDAAMGRIRDLEVEHEVTRTLVVRAILAVGLRHLSEVKSTLKQLKEVDA